jgi:hypothetical protein
MVGEREYNALLVSKNLDLSDAVNVRDERGQAHLPNPELPILVRRLLIERLS